MTTDQQVLSWLQRRVLEPQQDGGVTWASGLWTAAEVLGYVNQRQRRFLAESRIFRALADVPTNPHQLRYNLPDDCVEIFYVWWETPTGVTYPLDPMTAWQLDQAMPTWPTTDAPRPRVWITDAEVPIDLLQIMPAANDGGTLHLLYQSVGDYLDGSGVPLSVPDEDMPAVRWGALADMLSKPGRAASPSRAAYGEKRFADGVLAAKLRVMEPLNGR